MSPEERARREAEAEAAREARHAELRETYPHDVGANYLRGQLRRLPPLVRDARLSTNCAAYAEDAEKADAYALALKMAEAGRVEQRGRDRYCIFFTGQYGTGKTWLGTATWKALVYHAGAAFAREHMEFVRGPYDYERKIQHPDEATITHWKNLGNPLWAKFYAFIREVQDTYHRKSDEAAGDVIKRYQTAPVLMLDDVGDLDAPVESEDRRRLLYEVLDYRNDYGLPTVLTTNLSLSELEGAFGGRTVQRVIEMAALVEMGGKNMRMEG